MNTLLIYDFQATGNRLCDEKNDWLMTNLEYASVKQIYGKKKELEESLQYIFLKLEDSGKRHTLVISYTCRPDCDRISIQQCQEEWCGNKSLTSLYSLFFFSLSKI